jgi:hypothetical protein
MSEIQKNPEEIGADVVGDQNIAENFHQDGEPIDLSLDVNQRARLKSVGRDQSNGEDALVNSEGESIPKENPGVGGETSN